MNYRWEQKFNEARRGENPLRFPKSDVGDLPLEFEKTSDFGFIKEYESKRGFELLKIREGPFNYSVSVDDSPPLKIQPGPSDLPAHGESKIIGGPSKQDGGPGAAIAVFLIVMSVFAMVIVAIFGALVSLKRAFTSPSPVGGTTAPSTPTPTPTPSPKKTYKLFISHSWDYDDDYERLKKLLDDNPEFEFLDYSVPKEEPLEVQNIAELKPRLKEKIRPASAVIIISGMYTSYSNWIRAEMNIAKELGKPIIGVKPWGNNQLPTKVQEEAGEIVGWNSQSIANAVKENT